MPSSSKALSARASRRHRWIVVPPANKKKCVGINKNLYTEKKIKEEEE